MLFFFFCVDRLLGYVTPTRTSLQLYVAGIVSGVRARVNPHKLGLIRINCCLVVLFQVIEPVSGAFRRCLFFVSVAFLSSPEPKAQGELL